MNINDVTRESAAHRFLLKLETDVEHLCRMKASEWEKTLNCGEFIFVLKDSIGVFLSNDWKSCSGIEKKITKECLLETRKILRVLQIAYRTKVSSLTIHSMVSDMRNYIRDTRTKISRQ